MLRRVAGVHCVHYNEQKDCTARFATGGIGEIPEEKLNRCGPPAQAGLYTVQGWAPSVILPPWFSPPTQAGVYTVQ